jgi:hypothetical protein
MKLSVNILIMVKWSMSYNLDKNVSSVINYNKLIIYFATEFVDNRCEFYMYKQKQKTHQQISDDKITSNPHTMN